MGKLLTKFFIFLFILLICLPSFAWQKVGKSIEHAYFKCNDSKIHAVRFKHDDVFIKSVVYKSPGKTAPEVLKSQNADVVINASFFTPDITHIGLIINNGIQLSKIHKTSWWSVFYIENNIPKISLAKDITSLENISFAVQAGPRLLINEQIPSFKNKLDEVPRSVIGIDSNNKIILATVTNPGLTNEALAECLKTKSPKGPALINAMNLDGGSSTQMSVKTENELIHDLGLVQVPSFIVIKSK